MAGAAERIVHQLYRHDPGGLAVRPQPPPDRIAERQHRGVRLLGAGQIAGHCHAVAVAVVAAALLCHGVGLAAVGVVPQRIAARPEQRNHRGPVLCGQIPYCINAAAVQLFGRAGADAEQFPHRQRPHLFFHLVQIEGVNLVRLLKVRGHLGKQAVGGDAHIDRKAQLAAHAAADRVRSRQRRAEQRLGPGHVQKRFVNAVLLHIGRIVVQDLDQRLAVLHIPVKIRRHDRQPRAFGAGREEALPRFDAVLLGGAALGQHNAVALGFIAADHSRDGAQVHGAAVLQDLERRPGKKCRVYIDMKVDFCHTAFLLAGRCFFAWYHYITKSCACISAENVL